MDNEKYLLIFSGSRSYDETVAEDVIRQLSAEMDRFDIKELDMVDAPFANLVHRYLVALAGGLSEIINYNYSTIRITYNNPIAFKRNRKLESFLKGLVEAKDETCGASYAYLIKEGGVLLLHQFAIVTGPCGTFGDEDPTFFVEEIKPDFLYRHFYKQSLQDEDYILEAKMLLIAEEVV